MSTTTTSSQQQGEEQHGNQEDAGEATARPCFGDRSEKNLRRQKRYKKVFRKKASERERPLNGNYAL
jgi:hypothetical protein